jgi:MoaA/NifB/PqqE/SkfB family radical SAM enzyme
MIINLGNYGETFLNPDAASMIKAAHELGIRCRISTSLNFNLNEDKAREVVYSRMYRLTCSIGGPNQRVTKITA